MPEQPKSAHKAGEPYGTGGLDFKSENEFMDEREKWERKVGDLRVRAYENNDGSIILKWSDRTHYSGRDAIEVICKIHSIPIMPYTENEGNFERPR